MPFHPTSSPPSGVLLAEAVTFDPGLVVAAFLVFLLVCAGAIAVVVVGVVSGVRSARAPDLRRPLIVWRSCVAIEAAAALLATVTMAPMVLLVGAWGALASSIAARWLARPNPPAT